MNQRDIKEKIQNIPKLKHLMVYETSKGELVRSPYDAQMEELKILFLDEIKKFEHVHFETEELKRIWILCYLYGPQITAFIDKIEEIEQDRNADEEDVGNDLITKWYNEQNMEDWFDEDDERIFEEFEEEEDEEEEEEIWQPKKRKSWKPSKKH